MKITSSRITTLLTIGENLNIEFKRASNGPKADAFESVCAFLNKAGGDLLLGVDDDGTVVGPLGGPAPFTLIPSQPYVSSSSVTYNKTTKKLNINVTVKKGQ